MTKSDEKSVLRNAIATLGKDSYSGQWLADQLPAIEFAIDSDECLECRALTFAESRQQAEAILRNAKEQAAAIEKESKERADDLFRRAKSAIEFEKERLRDTLRKSISSL